MTCERIVRVCACVTQCVCVNECAAVVAAAARSSVWPWRLEGSGRRAQRFNRNLSCGEKEGDKGRWKS